MQKNSSERSRETSLRDVLAEITQDYVRQQKPASFHITIPGIGEIVCTEVFRVIFSKRIVCLGQENERYFIVKLYFAKHGAIRHWKRSAERLEGFCGSKGFQHRVFFFPDISLIMDCTPWCSNTSGMPFASIVRWKLVQTRLRGKKCSANS